MRKIFVLTLYIYLNCLAGAYAAPRPLVHPGGRYTKEESKRIAHEAPKQVFDGEQTAATGIMTGCVIIYGRRLAGPYQIGLKEGQIEINGVIVPGKKYLNESRKTKIAGQDPEFYAKWIRKKLEEGKLLVFSGDGRRMVLASDKIEKLDETMAGGTLNAKKLQALGLTHRASREILRKYKRN